MSDDTNPDDGAPGESPTNEKDAPSTERGFILKRRRRLPLIIGGVVAIVAIVLGITAIASSRSSSDDKEFGTKIPVAWDGQLAYGKRLAEFVQKEVGPDYGLDIQPVYLSDSNTINSAVNDGTVAGTTYEHKLWLAEVLDNNPDFDLTATVPLWYWTNSIWSAKYKTPSEIPDGATISITNSPANQSREFWILANAGLIKVKPGVKDTEITADDIDNPHNFKWLPLDYGAQPRALNDVDAIVGNATAFITAEVPRDKEIYVPPKQPDDYVGRLVVATRYKDQPNVKKLIEAFGDPRIQAFVANDPEVSPQLTAANPPSS